MQKSCCCDEPYLQGRPAFVKAPLVSQRALFCPYIYNVSCKMRERNREKLYLFRFVSSVCHERFSFSCNAFYFVVKKKKKMPYINSNDRHSVNAIRMQSECNKKRSSPSFFVHVCSHFTLCPFIYAN